MPDTKYPIDDRCRNCGYYLTGSKSELALRWAAMSITGVTVLGAVAADIYPNDWRISGTLVTFFVFVVLGFLLIAFHPKLYAYVRREIQK
jgi:hypothetical protein